MMFESYSQSARGSGLSRSRTYYHVSQIIGLIPFGPISHVIDTEKDPSRMPLPEHFCYRLVLLADLSDGLTLGRG